jgi:putative ABC transport system permease protein
MASGNLASTRSALDYMEKIWNKVSPDYPFEYEFMDMEYKSMYRAELHFFKIFMIASILAIFIACLGLFGVIYNVIVKKIKEIGVRKVNGAGITDIVLLLNKKFVINVFVALVISIPLSYFILKLWLENYAYTTDMSWWVFALAGTLVLLVSVLTVSLQSWKAAGNNPVKALRSE